MASVVGFAPAVADRRAKLASHTHHAAPSVPSLLGQLLGQLESVEVELLRARRCDRRLDALRQRQSTVPWHELGHTQRQRSEQQPGIGVAHATPTTTERDVDLVLPQGASAEQSVPAGQGQRVLCGDF